MEYTFVILLSLLSLILIIIHGYRYVYYVLIYNILVDVFSLFLPAGGFVAIIRATVLFYFFIYIFVKYKIATGPIKLIALFSIYTFTLVFFSSKIEYSFRVYTKVIISIIYFCVGYLTINNINRLKNLLSSIIPIMLIMIINTLVVNYFSNLKGFVYDEEQIMGSGNLGGQAWNTATYCLLLLPLIYHFENRKWMIYLNWIISFVLFIMLLFNLSRIPIIGLIFGYFIFFIVLRKKQKVFKILIPLLFFAIIINGFIWKSYIKQIQIRNDRYYLNAYETEARYLETSYVLDEVFSFKSIPRSLFGKEFMNSPGNYANGKFGNRQLHIDYNNILHGSGIFGFILYISIYISIYYQFVKIKSKLPRNDSTIDIIIALFHVFLFVPFILSFSGQMYAITFRSIGFIFLGALLRVLNMTSKKYKHQYIIS